MRINPLNPRPPDRIEAGPQIGPQLAASRSDALRNDADDESGLSDVALHSKELSESESREARVQQLRSAVQEGKYRVSAQEVARNIIDSHLAPEINKHS